MAPSEPKLSSSASVADDDETDYIGVINDLQNNLASIGHPLNIELPEIVVVGGQSAGKSSVLESFVGKEFLPRGQGLVTRRPIIVQLIPDSEEYGEFVHKPGEQFTDFSKIREEIDRATNEECRPNQYSMKPVTLSIHSPRVLKLTVVDLPGLIKVPTRDQSEQTVQTVHDMVRNYISRENTIILAVTEATADICTADALAMAKLVDPEGLRTIGVLTKVDSMQRGTDARDILENTLYPLKRGWVGAVNRSPEDIMEGKDMDYILDKERRIFDSDMYRHLKDRMGTLYLQKLLQKTLRMHIKENLTPVRIAISERLLSVQKELKEFENITGNGPNEKNFYTNKLINLFIKDIEVKLMGYSELVPSGKLTPGAIIKYTLYTEVKHNITSLPLVPDSEEIRTLISNHTGIRNSISVPSLVVDSICRLLIKKFKVPLKQSVMLIKEILETTIQESAALIDAYPTLKNELIYLIQHWIEEAAEKTYERLESHIDAKMFFLNLIHPDFDMAALAPVAPPAGPLNLWPDSEETKESLNNVLANKESKDSTDNTATKGVSASSIPANDVNVSTSTSKSLFTEKQMSRKLEINDAMTKQVNFVTAIVIKYLELVQKEVLDLTITYINYFLVKQLNTRIADDLGPTIMNSANMASLMEDYDDDFRRQQELRFTRTSLEQASVAIKDF